MSNSVIEEMQANLVKLQKRLEKLEEKLATDRLTLISPNGEYKIALVCMDTGCGLWLSNEKDRKAEMVAIYNGFNQGAVIGVYDQGLDSKLGIDICIASGMGEGPRMQVVTDHKNVYEIKAKDLAKLAEVK